MTDPAATTDELVAATCRAATRTRVTTGTWARFMNQLERLRGHSERMYQHSLRVGLIAAQVAAVEHRDAASALIAGCGHDIGKTVVPVDVIDADPFGPTERATMKSHPEAGFLMLTGTHLTAACVAGLHHRFQPDSYGVTLDVTWLPTSTKHEVWQLAELVAMIDCYDSCVTRRNEDGHTMDATEAVTVLRTRFGDNRRVDRIVAATRQ